MIELICLRCGKTFQTKSYTAKFCQSCRQEKKKENERKAKIKLTDNTRREKWPSDKKCKKCIYSVFIANHWICNFVEVRGRLRGCEYGDNCVEFVPKKDKKTRLMKGGV